MDTETEEEVSLGGDSHGLREFDPILKELRVGVFVSDDGGLRDLRVNDVALVVVDDGHELDAAV